MTLPDDVERAIPRGSRVPWERRLLRLVEPDASPEAEPVEPGADAPMAERIAYWEDRERWATSSAEHAAAVSALARLRSGHHEAAEPARTPPAATLAPKTRPVLHRVIEERDSVGRITRVKEWTSDEPIPEGTRGPSPPDSA